MPPTPETVPLPTGRGKDAYEFLESRGIVARVPPIRSSDIHYLVDPFRYYLVRRLGLAKPDEYSEALSLGTWAHVCMELHGKSGYEARIADQKALVTEKAKTFGWRSDKVRELADRVERDAQKARVIWEAALDYPVGGEFRTLREFLDWPHWRLLGTELVLKYKDPRWPRTPLVVQLDRLLYNEKDKTLVIPDLKTTSKSPLVRLASCPLEYQTRLYTHVVDSMLEDGSLQANFNLPPQTRLKAFMHIAVQKPTINLSQEDRDFTEKEHTLQSGPRKGQIEIRREYHGDPKWPNYLERVKRQMYGLGEYEKLSEIRKMDPPVNFSWTWARTFDDADRSEFRAFTDSIYKMATELPYPVLFPRNGANMEGWNSVDVLAPFYATPVGQWPKLMSHLQVVQYWREDDIESFITGESE